jgi:hypothetical protein
LENKNLFSLWWEVSVVESNCVAGECSQATAMGQKLFSLPCDNIQKMNVRRLWEKVPGVKAVEICIDVGGSLVQICGATNFFVRHRVLL